MPPTTCLLDGVSMEQQMLNYDYMDDLGSNYWKPVVGVEYKVVIPWAPEREQDPFRSDKERWVFKQIEVNGVPMDYSPGKTFLRSLAGIQRQGNDFPLTMMITKTGEGTKNIGWAMHVIQP